MGYSLDRALEKKGANQNENNNGAPTKRRNDATRNAVRRAR